MSLGTHLWALSRQYPSSVCPPRTYLHAHFIIQVPNGTGHDLAVTWELRIQATSIPKAREPFLKCPTLYKTPALLGFVWLIKHTNCK